MQCDSALSLIWAWIDEHISAEEEQQLHAHLASCAACREQKALCANHHKELRSAWDVDTQTVDTLKHRIKTMIAGSSPAKEDKVSLLIVDDESAVRRALSLCLASEFDVVTAGSADSARTRFAKQPIDMILSDHVMPGQSGVQLLEWVKENYPHTIRLLMTGAADRDSAIDAINRGKIYHYLLKPWSAEEWLPVLRNAADKFLLMRKQEELLEQLHALNLDLEDRVLERTRALQEAVHELRQKNKTLAKLALTDPLTGLPNRRAMSRLAEHELRRRTRYPSPLGIGMIDIDHFKDINTRLHHTGGDKILTELAKCLQSSLRNVDLLGRVGGEEFLVIAPETSMAGFHTLGERIRSVVEHYPFTYKDKPVKVTVSLGFAVADVGVQADYARMKETADAALLRAKTNGRNRLELMEVAA